MTTAENIAQFKDIVLIVFLVFSFALMLFATVLSLRLYRRVTSFMDRMEHVAEGFEETFGRVAVARQAVEEAALALRPVAKGLGLIGAFQGVGRLFGGGGSSDDDSVDKSNK
jgi:hypothetical protein